MKIGDERERLWWRERYLSMQGLCFQRNLKEKSYVIYGVNTLIGEVICGNMDDGDQMVAM